MRDKILIFVILVLSVPKIYASNTITEFNSNDIQKAGLTSLSNPKLYLPNGFKIINEKVEIRNSNSYDISKIEGKVKELNLGLGQEKFKKLLTNDSLFILGSEEKRELFGLDGSRNDIPLNSLWYFDENKENTLEIKKGKSINVNYILEYESNKLEESKTLEFYTINPELNWYTANPYKQFPTIFIYDNIVLPQNIKAINKNITYNGELVLEELKIELKYKIMKFKYGNERNYTYIFVPYYEMKINNINSNNTLELSYDLINEIHFEKFNTQLNFGSDGIIKFINY